MVMTNHNGRLSESCSRTVMSTHSNEAEAAAPAPDPGPPPLPPPRDDPFTLQSLWAFNGTDPAKALLVSIKGTVFDVSSNPAVYGMNCSYHMFTGRDCSYAMGKSSLRWEDAYPDYSALNETEVNVLDTWHATFSKKYPIAGKLIDHPTLLAEMAKGKSKIDRAPATQPAPALAATGAAPVPSGPNKLMNPLPQADDDEDDPVTASAASPEPPSSESEGEEESESDAEPEKEEKKAG
ncbi:Cytochrome B5 [Mycena chlorophos]|uniref:Cytochrome B5 n=1 Tax=Mycena chlorophos TaxID=658473 RepID=A0A8H6SUE1_MYCCL|nr:Cytochrome B5 [Mycena chlorophos]